MSHYIIGIDTGGTYTDAILFDAESKTVIAAAKEPTTHHHLALSTGRSLHKLLQKADIDPSQIKQLSLSTTLATNAVVEKKGARVAAFIIGYVKHFRLPITATIFIKGGHNIMGEEEEPLDIDNIVDTLHGLRNDADAYAICSAMSMNNPSHELVTEKAISMIDSKPCFCSHRISQHAGMRERAATAALHAKLMPLMQEYIDGVKDAMQANKLHCPVSLITGNGEQITIGDAAEHAGVTVASGPACTAAFGASQRIEDALVIDVGGTTTDIAMIENGKTVLSPDGCQIGDWQTHMDAVDMFTGGIGGDSHVQIDSKGSILLGPGRVIPLAMTEDFPAVSDWLGAGNRAKCISLLPEVDAARQTSAVIQTLSGKGPCTLQSLHEATGISGVPLAKQLEQLSRQQMILETGFTPTDALHVLGKIDIGNAENAQAGAKILGDLAGMNAESFSKKIVALTAARIEDMLIDYVIHRYWGKSLTSFISSRSDHPVLGVNFSLKIPIIGIGAAARYFLPAVADHLGTTVHFPKHCNVGNGVGAALLGT